MHGDTTRCDERGRSAMKTRITDERWFLARRESDTQLLAPHGVVAAGLGARYGRPFRGL